MRRLAVLSVLAWGCSSPAPLLPSNVLILEGQESDLWTLAPAPARLEINLVEGDQRMLVGQASAPTSGFPIANSGVPLGKLASFEASAFDGSSATVAQGSSVTFFLSYIDGIDVPIFVARSGGWSRPPDTLEHPHQKPVVVSALHELVIVAGGDALPGADRSVPDFYSVATWTTLRSQPPLPRAPKSAGVVADSLLAIDDTGASWLDLSSDGVEAATAVAGATFAEIAGGDTVTMTDGTLFIVGATRSTGDPTSKVLRVGTDRTIKTLALSTPRIGAAAGVVGDKLVIAGGSADGAGVEVLNDMQTAFVTLGVPADPTTGLGLAGLDAMTVLLAGGKDPATGISASVRTLDVSCGATCTIGDHGALPSSLTGAHVFRLGSGKALVTGDTDDGETHAFVVTTGGVTLDVAERPLRERRKGATASVLPNGQIGLIGGVSVDGTNTPVSTFEAYFP